MTRRKDLLDLQSLSAEEIVYLLDTAQSFKEIVARPVKKVPTLRGKSVATLFFEPSTRTRTSFEAAAKIMSADTYSLAGTTSSAVKGESLKDTMLTLDAMGIDAFVIRHGFSGAAHLAAQYVPTKPVINAGDGTHEHPTQGLLDLLTIREVKGRVAGLTVAIVGDIAHSRVARSNLWGLHKMGANVRLVGPSTLMPADADQLPCRGLHRPGGRAARGGRRQRPANPVGAAGRGVLPVRPRVRPPVRRQRGQTASGRA